MRPGNAHAAGMPNRLPDQPLVFDKQGTKIAGGRPEKFSKVLRSMKAHHAEEVRRRDR